MTATYARKYVIALGALTVGLVGCYHSTRLAATWHDPTLTPVHFRQTVVAFVTKDEALRRTVEDKLAASFPGGVPSYRVVPNASEADSAAIRRQLGDLGFDGALVMRVVDVDTRVSDGGASYYVGGPYWYRRPYAFGPYWRSAWAYPYDPYYNVNVDRVVSIETQVYSLQNDRLVWAGRSETTNPQSAGKLTDSVIKHVMKAMHNEGVLALLGIEVPTVNTVNGER